MLREDVMPKSLAQARRDGGDRCGEVRGAAAHCVVRDRLLDGTGGVSRGICNQAHIYYTYESSGSSRMQRYRIKPSGPDPWSPI